MIWPFTELERMREQSRHFDGAREAWIADTQGSSQAWAASDAALRRQIAELIANNLELSREIASLKKSKVPEGEFFTCQCGCHSFITQAHLIGWKEGEHTSVPLPLGGLVMCANTNCKTLWRMDDEGMQKVNPREQQKPPEGKRRKPDSDDDLQWSPRR